MKQMVWDTMKVFIIFVACTCLFYFGLRMMHDEYEQYHRYDLPEGPAVKVFGDHSSLVDRLPIIFRFGE
ncbi:YqzK family protein [Virgibacillus halophilus]|uniref:YqzK family protein n=1 Tax=Tigheibacillus halophilus TaxID=361280 RepID=A0ABU5CAZ9_9BACI|nr:YqzK family protein [Virgibacillus halophilus]